MHKGSKRKRVFRSLMDIFAKPSMCHIERPPAGRAGSRNATFSTLFLISVFFILNLSAWTLNCSAQDTIGSISIDSTLHPDSGEVSIDSIAALNRTARGSQHLYDNDLLTKEFHQGRRNALRALLPDYSVAVFFANPVRNRSNDINYEYHQDPDFYYLTGLNEPHSLLLIFKQEQELDSIVSDEFIFIQQRDSALERWTGKKMGKEGVKSILGFNAVFLNDEFASLEIKLPLFNKVFYMPTYNDIRDDKTDRGDLFSLLKHFKLKLDTGLKNVDTKMLREMMSSLREIKMAEELTLMRYVINITCDAHKELMRALKPEMTEYQAEAIVEYMFKTNGAEYTGFPSTIGGGENTCILHYSSNRRKLTTGDLLVVDIGAEYHGYAADVTRTLPVNGKFTEEQKTIYNIVLKAQIAGIRACKVGNKFWAPNTAAISVIKKGLLQVGLIEKGFEYRKYFMHGTSHYLGLDVHDAGLYGILKPGNVITVEPGIYIPEGSDCDPKWWNIGIRIEDDVLITSAGPDILSDCVPKSVEEIEKLMQEEGLPIR